MNAADLLALLDDIGTEPKVILVGHSLGGSILLKYLSEANVEESIAGIFLIATPYWGAEDWQVDEYALHDSFATRLPKAPPIFFYHSDNDDLVPFAHLALYAEKLPYCIEVVWEKWEYEFYR